MTVESKFILTVERLFDIVNKKEQMNPLLVMVVSCVGIILFAKWLLLS